MRYGILFTLFYILSFTLEAQVSSLTGTVQLTDGNPVPYATVTIRSSARSVITDDSGRFVFDRIRHGDYQVEVTSLEITAKVFHIGFKNSKPLILTVEPPQPGTWKK